jgi:hypothetical protein
MITIASTIGCIYYIPTLTTDYNTAMPFVSLDKKYIDRVYD